MKGNKWVYDELQEQAHDAQIDLTYKKRGVSNKFLWAKRDSTVQLHIERWHYPKRNEKLF